MIFTPEERRAILGLLGLLLLGQGVAFLRDERKARPDRELSAWLTRAQAARAESLGAAAMGTRPAGRAQAGRDAGLAAVLPGFGSVANFVVSQSDTSRSASAFEDDSEGAESAVRASSSPDSVPIEDALAVPAGIAATGRIAINRASARDLEALPGIGPSLAKRIVEERARSGPFRAPRDLLRVKGIGPKKLAECQDRIDWS
jgi:competence protein ComEA